MLTATLSYTAITRDYAQSLTRTAADPTVARETKYYLDNIGKVKTVDDLLNNSRLYNYVLNAFDLGEMRSAKGLIRKVLQGGVSDPDSLANTMYDRRYKALASAFDFPANGAETTSKTAARQGTTDRYLDRSLEANAGRQNEGARMALYFKRVAPNITSTTGILADKTLLMVVQTAFGLARSMSFQPIERQANLIEKHLAIADLKDPAKLQKLIVRFTANYDAKNSQTTASAYSFGSGSIGLSSSLLSSLANLKLGGS
jgi:hypothetical protein